MDAAAIGTLTELSLVDQRLRELGTAPSPERQELEQRRQALRWRLSAFVLVLYDALERTGRRPPVAAIADGACGVCRHRLSPQLLQDAQSAGIVRPCPHCRRLLFAPLAEK